MEPHSPGVTAVMGDGLQTRGIHVIVSSMKHNESQVSHCWRREMKIQKGKKLARARTHTRGINPAVCVHINTHTHFSSVALTNERA